jgi:hypothetical protein
MGVEWIAVANTLDLITSDLPYRAAQSFGAYPIHHAVVLVGCRAFMPVVRQKTIPLVGEARSVLGNINKMSVVGFVSLGSNIVRPVCDRCEARITDQ